VVVLRNVTNLDIKKLIGAVNIASPTFARTGETPIWIRIVRAVVPRSIKEKTTDK
jgi:hypothetical protein